MNALQMNRHLAAFRSQTLAATTWAELGDRPSQLWFVESIAIYDGDEDGFYPDPPLPPWWPTRRLDVIRN